LVDVFQSHGVGNEGLQLEFALHVAVHVARQFGPALDATEGGTAPDAASHQLEGTGGNLLASAGTPDDYRFAPALVAAFQRRAHDFHVADTFERVIHAAVSQFHDHFLDGAVVIQWIDAVGGAELLGHLEFLGIDINPDDATGLRLDRTQNGG